MIWSRVAPFAVTWGPMSPTPAGCYSCWTRSETPGRFLPLATTLLASSAAADRRATHGASVGIKKNLGDRR